MSYHRLARNPTVTHRSLLVAFTYCSIDGSLLTVTYRTSVLLSHQRLLLYPSFDDHPLFTLRNLTVLLSMIAELRTTLYVTNCVAS